MNKTLIEINNFSIDKSVSINIKFQSTNIILINMLKSSYVLKRYVNMMDNSRFDFLQKVLSDMYLELFIAIRSDQALLNTYDFIDKNEVKQ